MFGRVHLIARFRRVFVDGGEHGRAASSGPGRDELRALEARITHLEQLVEGLQDSVHRESTRMGKRVGELEARIHPAVLGKALSEDARERGL